MPDMSAIRAVADELASAGYRRHYDDTTDRTLTLRAANGSVELSTLAALQARVDERLGALPPGRDAGPRTRLVREHLPDATADEIGDYLAAVDAARVDPAAQREAYRQNRRDKRAATIATARDVVAYWLTDYPVGRHEIGTVWDSWSDAVAESSREDLAEIGRTTFYAILADLGEVRPGGGHKRYLVIPGADA